MTYSIQQQQEQQIAHHWSNTLNLMFGLPDSGSTLHYWLLVPLLLTLTSMFITILAQTCAHWFWDEIELKPLYKNRPKSNSILYYVLNHSMAALLTSFCIVYTRYYGSLYEDFDIWQNVCSFSKMFETCMYLVQVLLCVLFMMILYDLLVYLFHRTCHSHPTLYSLLHKQHHENNSPRGILDAIYGDAWESTIIAFFSCGQMMFFPFPISSVVVFLFVISFFVQWNHSGRKIVIPYIYNFEYHAAHHRYFKVNFSEHVMLWDYLFGTLRLNYERESY
ncbi:hypothetical protein C9374_014621 [Naegleria lovaniensis]|uniref:Fatty acid hydroxylase domain-containing protein n=1 Tax=Naegleria lovaniensis TaxID=51637 RepID=A0AA88GVK2_NAELO|nr:uncharacterized protein C9374_014621 [Naegleria lovaniensis]KAG2389221.1 hypothetical protein C9374_014621 [Naegleria lovaniensis]